MMALDSLLIKALKPIFGYTPLPAGLKDAVEADAILVTQAKGVVIQALLASFASRLQSEQAQKQDPTYQLTTSYLSHSLIAGAQVSEIAGSNARALKETRQATSAPSGRILRWVSVHDREALELLLKNEPNKTFSTLSIFFARGPLRSNPSHRISFLKQVALVLRARHIVPVTSAPVAAPSSPSIGSLQRFLKVDFYRTLKLIRGTPLQPLDAQMRAILSGAEFERELNVVAARGKTSKEKLFGAAQREFLSMAANPRLSVFWLLAPLARFIIRRLFAAVKTSGLKELVPAVRENTVVLVPMHRSHLDYIIVGSTLYDAGINPPLVAAGVNLNFWPIGFFIRSVGAYFVKRNAKHDRLHALLLRRYVTYLIKRGQLQEFFIEGGRSRSGKMRPPKVGLLSIMTDAYLKGLRRDILFVPVSITYETVVEDKVYGDENTGKRKLKENAFSLLQASKIFRKSYGDVMLHFGNPMSVAAFRQNYIEQSNEENKTVVVELAHELTRNIRQQSHISLTSLAATALLLAPRYALPRQTLVAQIRSFALAIERLRKFDPSTGPFTPSLVHFLEGREIILDDLTRSGFVGVQECLGQELFFVPGQRRFTADFYKNSCSHVFSELGFLSLLALLKVELRSKESEWLYDLCAFDLLLISKQRFFNRLEKLIESMRQENELSPDSIQFASTQSPLFIPGIFLTQFQSLWWVHLNLAHFLAHNEGKTELRHATFVDTLQTNAKAGLYLGQLARSEASSQAALLAALDGMQQRGLVQIIESGGKPETLKVAADLSAERAFVRTLNEAVLRTLVQTSPAPES